MQQFEAQISGLEQQRSVLIDEIQSTKDKAHSMLAEKDTEVSQMRNVIAKLKSWLVTKTEITPEEMQDLLNAQIAP
jgi:chromosome condensin MukBEF ATPase and DNA-binding subunit MukB